jgi:5-methylcytosine-specific restriction enzyme subunit McrC
VGRVVHLIERRTREVRLPRADVDFLRNHAQDVIEVAPAFASGRYRLTPRGLVGFLDGPSLRFEIAPKFPWPNSLLLLGLGSASRPTGDIVVPEGGLLAALARELACRLRDVAAAGLVRGYRDDDHASPFLRGRLRVNDQIRDAAARAFPDRFQVTESVFDLDTPWNRIPRAVVSELVAHSALPTEVRNDLAVAAAPFDDVPLGPIHEADFAATAQEPRAAGYNGLVALCRVIHSGFAAAGASVGPGQAFLVDLGHAFERFLADSVAAAFAGFPEWSVEAQPESVIGAIRGEPIVLRPDIVIRRRGKVRAVLDAKWKLVGPDAADLHQILAYATIFGANRVGLVYPGQRFGRREFRVAGGRIAVSLVRVPLFGALTETQTVGERLARVIRKPIGSC